MKLLLVFLVLCGLCLGQQQNSADLSLCVDNDCDGFVHTQFHGLCTIQLLRFTSAPSIRSG